MVFAPGSQAIPIAGTTGSRFWHKNHSVAVYIEWRAWTGWVTRNRRVGGSIASAVASLSSTVSNSPQSVFGRLGGYEDWTDASRLGGDAAMRWPTIWATSCARFRGPKEVEHGAAEDACRRARQRRPRVVKIGAKGVGRERPLTFRWAEVAGPRRRFREILRRIIFSRPAGARRTRSTSWCGS